MPSWFCGRERQSQLFETTKWQKNKETQLEQILLHNSFHYTTNSLMAIAIKWSLNMRFVSLVNSLAILVGVRKQRSESFKMIKFWVLENSQHPRNTTAGENFTPTRTYGAKDHSRRERTINYVIPFSLLFLAFLRIGRNFTLRRPRQDASSDMQLCVQCWVLLWSKKKKKKDVKSFTVSQRQKYAQKGVTQHKGYSV